jgi:hypothetical protein
MSVTYIAYANGSKNGLGPADSGVSVYRKIVEDGQVMEEQEIASWVVAEVSDEDGDLDTERAEKFLRDSGWEVTGAGWGDAADGQWVIEVEQAGL